MFLEHVPAPARTPCTYYFFLLRGDSDSKKCLVQADPYSNKAIF